MRALFFLLALTLPLVSQAAEPMGRLFMTPAERTSLDYLRQTSTPPEKIVRGEEDEALGEDAIVPAAPPAPVSVQGYVKRTDGKGTVWVNHQPLLEKTGKGDLEVGKLSNKSNRVTVKLPANGQTVELKPGQIYDPVSGKIVEHPRELPQSEPALPPAATPVAP